MLPRLSSSGRRYLVSVAAITLGVTGLLLAWDTRPAIGALTFVCITGLGMLTHAFPVRGQRHQAYQVTLPFIIIAAALFNVAQLIGFLLLIHAAEQLRVRRPLLIQAFNLCDYILAAALAGIFFQRASAILVSGPLSSVEAAMAAGCIFIVLNRALLMGALWTARGLSPSRSGLLKPELLAADLVIVWISGPMLVLTIQAGPLMVLITATPLLLARPALAALVADRDRPAPPVQARAS